MLFKKKPRNKQNGTAGAKQHFLGPKEISSKVFSKMFPTEAFLAHLVRRTDELLGWVAIRRQASVLRPSVRYDCQIGLYLKNYSS